MCHYYHSLNWVQMYNIHEVYVHEDRIKNNVKYLIKMPIDYILIMYCGNVELSNFVNKLSPVF